MWLIVKRKKIKNFNKISLSFLWQHEAQGANAQTHPWHIKAENN